MRIDSNRRTNGVTGRSKADRVGASADFHLPEAQASGQAAKPAPVSAAASLDALLALQAVGDALQAPRRRALMRGRTLLDTLEEVRADLLVGGVGPEKLDSLVALVSQSREAGTPDLDALLDDIELRVRVELAKLGRYPAF
jgi:hypothetical protein